VRCTSGTGSEGRAVGGMDVVTEIGSGVIDLPARPCEGDGGGTEEPCRARWLGGGGRSETRGAGMSDAVAALMRPARSSTGSRGRGLVGRSESAGREGGGSGGGTGGGCDAGRGAAVGCKGGGGSDPTVLAWDPSAGPVASSPGLAGAETVLERTSSDINDSRGPHRNE
jgi:hypothetical protein